MRTDNVDFEDASAQYQALVTKVTEAIRAHKNAFTTGRDDDALARKIIIDVSAWLYGKERRS